MGTLIVYYSLEGNTEYVAEKIARACGFDLLRIVPKKKYPSKGLNKFLWGGFSVVMSETPELEPYDFDHDAYDRIVFGFPVWASNITPPIRTFIKENDLKGKKIAAFACQSGNGAEKAFGKMKSAIGIDELEAELVLIDPKMKYRAENNDKINAFCSLLKEDG